MGHQKCDSYLLFKFETSLGGGLRTTLYFFGLAYCFVGLSAITARFFRSMENVVKHSREVVVTDPITKVEIVTNEKVWNYAIADISLSAFGTSFPQISLATIDAIRNLGSLYAGGLGPGTLVGSAAFDLFSIHAVCVIVPKAGQVKKISDIGVWLVELFWSFWAYIWLYIILKSILITVAKEFPKAEHRHCARHLFANWHKTYKGPEMKQLFWACAKSYNEADFNENLKELTKADPKAADAFLACKPPLFCRAFLNTWTKNDVIVNNMAETFNAYIINARAKHLLYMLEDISVSLMQRLIKKRVEMENKVGLLCPRVQLKLDKEKELASMCIPLPSSVTVYQVQMGDDYLIVDLGARTCTCKKWNLTGIPCCHAIAAISDKYEKAEKYVDDCYKRETYLSIYNYTITPVPGERHWSKVDKPLNPPAVKIGPGRPRKNRIRDPFEDPKKSGKLTKHGLEMTCSICKSKSHNKRRCPNKDKAMSLPDPQPKRGRGRPRAPHNLHMNDSAPVPTHHNISAQPTRVGRNGRLIPSGRGARGVGRRVGRAGRGGRAIVGVGVLFDGSGNIINKSNSTMASTQ